MNHENIKKAYLEILNRPADPNGIQYYSTLDLSYEDLCENLKKSAEYRRNNNISIADSKYLSWPYSQIFVARNIKVLYCPIAKNACSSLKRLILSISDIKNKTQILKGDIHANTDQKNTGIQIKDLSNEQIAEALTSPEYLRFVVLRDPISRLVSAYWEKFVINRTNPNNLVHTLPVIERIHRTKGLPAASPEMGITFSEFVGYVCSSSPYQLDAHWKPQYTYLEGISYNAYYDQRNLTPLYNDLTQRCGRQVEALSYNITNSGKGEKLGTAFDKTPKELLSFGKIDKASFFNSHITEAVQNYYQKDFDLLKKAKE